MNPTHVASTFAMEVVRELRRLLIPEVREIGDVRRNAAVFLARRAGDKRSSFERNLRPSIDSARLSEVPYLSSLGYLVTAGLLSRLPEVQVRRALDAVTRRAAHTAERTGYADDAMCACGLLLLANELGHSELAGHLRDGLIETSRSDIAVAAVVAAATSAIVRTTVDVSPDNPEHVAAALLVGRVDESARRGTFPGLPADLEGHLLRALTSPGYRPAADFGAMLVLAAIEASMALPDDELPAVDGRCDVGVVIALKEEFRILFDRFADRHTHVEDGGRSYYLFDASTVAGGRPYRCIATLVGEMGTNRTGVVVEKLLRRWDPSTVIIVGIAGGIHSDVKLGDVIVASEIDNYLEGAKAADGNRQIEFKRAGDSFKVAHALLERVRNFEFASRAVFQRWEMSCADRRTELGDDGEALLQEALLREVPVQREGHIASGPVVVASKDFADWIRAGDRSYLGIEMEAAGLMIASHMDPGRCDALVIRGVSDFGDERKARLDAINGGAVRRYAMENATDFLWALMEAGVLRRSPRPADAPAAASATAGVETVEAALLRVLRAHADVDGEVTATWQEISGWLGGTKSDLHAAAIHLKQDGYFRSAMFEGGLDGYCNVVLRK